LVLEIFSVLGRKVRSLEHGQQVAGVHSKVWDGMDDAGSRVAAGFYWVRLTDGSRANAKRLLLMR
jgi:flagellar hook assembly protein FlgD